MLCQKTFSSSTYTHTNHYRIPQTQYIRYTPWIHSIPRVEINTTNDPINHGCPQNTIIYTQCNHTGRHLQSCYMYEFLLNTTNSELIFNTYTIKWIYSFADTRIRYIKSTKIHISLWSYWTQCINIQDTFKLQTQLLWTVLAQYYQPTRNTH